MKIQKATKLLNDFQKIPKRKRNRTFMEISGYPHYENVCSNILKFFFEIDNEHDLNDLFIKSLLETCKIDIDNEFHCENIVVEKEITTRKGNRLDLLIVTDEFVIGIENKIFHSLDNDLRDYSGTIDTRARLDKKTTLKIVLSLKEIQNSKLEKNNFINITYPDLFNNIKNNLGNYVLIGNSDFIVYLKGFMNTINNLIGNNMENRELNKFFEQNTNTIQELTKEFSKYKTEIFNKVYQLRDIVDKDEYAAKSIKQWVASKNILVHDYLILDNFRIAIDTYISLDGWKIQLFGRDAKSRDFILNEMFNSPIFHGIEKKDNRLNFAKFEVQVEIDLVAKSLIEMLELIEKYIENLNTQKVK